MSKTDSRLSKLTPEQRAVVIERARQRTSGSGGRECYDVIVVGGGLAGLSLALQLKRARPAIRVVVLEKSAFPAPEAAFKVGESTVEVAARYFEKLEMREHLKKNELPKLGLRFFFPAGDNSDIKARMEVGSFTFPPYLQASYQLDRGRFENALAAECRRAGVVLRDGLACNDVTLDPAGHRVAGLSAAGRWEVEGRWIVDASGRRSLIKQKLGLSRPVTHDANAVWFRIADEIDIGQWSSDPDWLARIPPGMRRLSTNHLLGAGYWVWLIPLASGSTSIGIVADPSLHPLDQMNRFDRALAWLERYEPQCAREVARRQHLLQDFRALRHYAHGCEQVYSADRWCITGDAGVFLDPFYSPGSDFISYSNTYITDLIVRDLSEEDVTDRIRRYNDLLLHTWFDTTLWLYDRQYPVMGNDLVMSHKIVWDFALYWGVVGFLWFHDAICDLELMDEAEPELRRYTNLQRDVQDSIRAWNKLGRRPAPQATIDYFSHEILCTMHRDLTAVVSRDQIVQRLRDHLDLLAELAGSIIAQAADALRDQDSFVLSGERPALRPDASGQLSSEEMTPRA